MNTQNSNASTAGKGELTQEQEWIAQGETPEEQERRATELSLGRIRAIIKDWEEHERPKSLWDVQGANIFIRLWRWLIGTGLFGSRSLAWCWAVCCWHATASC